MKSWTNGRGNPRSRGLDCLGDQTTRNEELNNPGKYTQENQRGYIVFRQGRASQGFFLYTSTTEFTGLFQ
jgi:hypothetical protein